MSFKFSVVPTLAATDTRLSHAQYRLLSILASFADKNGECFPSQTTLGNMSGIARNKVCERLAEIKKLGWITSSQRSSQKGVKTSNLYKIMYEYRPPVQDEVRPSDTDLGSPSEQDTEDTSINTPIEDIALCAPVIDKLEHGMSEMVDEIDADDFGIWFNAYPRQQRRPKAKIAYRAARKKTDAGELLNAAEAYAKEVHGWDMQRIKWAENWLKEEMWEDYQREVLSQHVNRVGNKFMCTPTQAKQLGAVKVGGK